MSELTKKIEGLFRTPVVVSELYNDIIIIPKEQQMNCSDAVALTQLIGRKFTTGYLEPKLQIINDGRSQSLGYRISGYALKELGYIK
jgi:hypothetical protein